MDIQAFFQLNLTCLLIGLGWFAYSWRTAKLRFVKPSTIILLFSALLFQVPLTIGSDVIYRALPHPEEVSFLVNGYVLAGMVVASFSFPAATATIWSKLAVAPKMRSSGAITIVGLGSLSLVTLYLAYVPLGSTGLYALLSGQDQEAFSAAREGSLKTLGSAIPMYALSIYSFSAAPILSSLMAQRLLARWRVASWAERLYWVFGITVVSLAAALTGAKGIFVFILLGIAFTFALRTRLEMTLFAVGVGAALTLIPAVVITVALSASADGASWTVAVADILGRALLVPFLVDIWYVDFAQQGGGPAGVAAIRPLAFLFDVPYLDLPNYIGTTYAPAYYGHEVASTISATGGYLFYFYAMFGLASLPLSIFLLFLTDIVLLLLRWLEGPLLVAAAAALLVAAQKFTQSDYTTVWITHGFIVIPLIAVLATSILSRNAPRTAALSSV